jgi:hypothetical protein
LRHHREGLFVNYTEHERACDKLKRLAMAGDHAGEYVTMFELLACRANMKLDGPKRFAQWTRMAQRQQKAWMRTQSIQNDNYENTVSTECSDDGMSDRPQEIMVEDSSSDEGDETEEDDILWKRISQNRRNVGRMKRTGKTGQTWRTASEPETPTHLNPPDYSVDDMDGIAVV